MQVIDPATAINVDLNDIRCVTKVGGTIDDTELVNGVVLTQSALKSAGGPARMEKAKIGIIQFQLSPPKPDVCFNRGWFLSHALCLSLCISLCISLSPFLFPSLSLYLAFFFSVSSFPPLHTRTSTTTTTTT